MAANDNIIFKHLLSIFYVTISKYSCFLPAEFGISNRRITSQLYLGAFCMHNSLGVAASLHA